MTDHREARSLDRALAEVPMPQVPAGLAARITGEVTRLPQQRPVEAPLPASPAGRSNPRWKRMAAAAGLALLVGTATLAFRGSGVERGRGEQLAAARKIAPVAEAALALPPLHPAAPLAAETSALKHAPAAPSEDAPMPSAPGDTELAVAPAPAPEPTSVVAQQDVARPAATVVEPLQASTPMYGPSAPPQGFGIAGGNGTNMPRSAATGGPGHGGLGGPPHR